MKTLTLAAAAVWTAAPVLAHPGHAAADQMGQLHWLTQVDHLAALAVSGSVAVGLWLVHRARRGGDGS